MENTQKSNVLEVHEGKVRRIHSFVWGGLILVALLVYGFVDFNSTNNSTSLITGIVLGILGFTFSSCLILNNNFIIDMIAKVFSWGFVTFPGLIFSLDLDGIIWFLTVKLLCWILGIILAIVFGILAVALGLVVSIFVYPYAIVHNFRDPGDC